jgi:photosystem II stability/assembly factor-like uncharacterized protein
MKICRSGIPIFIAALCAGCSASGPAIGVWEETGGPNAQNIRAVLADSRIAGTVYASTGSGEIAVSTSDGRTWAREGAISGVTEVRQMAQDPDNSNRLMAATDAGAFLSTDRGRSWTPMRVGPPGTGVRVLAIDPWATSTIYAGTEGKGLYRTSDGGKTWNDINTSADLLLSGTDVYDIAIDLSKPDVVYAALSPFGVVGTTDGGARWEGLTPEFSGSGSRVTHLLLRKQGRGMLLYGTTSGSIMKSTNGGSSWSPSRTGKDFEGILSLAGLPGEPDGVIAGTERGIIYSPDFGSRWTAMGWDLPAIPIRVAVAGAGTHTTLFAYGNGLGMRASHDHGKSWRSADMNLGGSTVSLLAIDPSGGHLFAATGDMCMSYTTGSSSGWADAGPGLSGGPVRSLAADPTVPGLVYATTDAGMFLSTDNGRSWQAAPRSLQVSPFLYEAHPAIATRMYMACDQGIFVSTDRGVTWGQSRPLGSRWRVHQLTFCPSNAGTIIGATTNSGVIQSLDGGFTWELACHGITGDRVDAIALDDADPGIYYAYLPDGTCFRSLNGGLEWNRYAGPWKQPGTIRFARDPGTPSSIIALVDNRQVYYSMSGGGTWFRLFNADLHGDAVTLCWNAATMTLYAGTRDRGVSRLSLRERIHRILGE